MLYKRRKIAELRRQFGREPEGHLAREGREGVHSARGALIPAGGNELQQLTVGSSRQIGSSGLGGLNALQAGQLSGDRESRQVRNRSWVGSTIDTNNYQWGYQSIYKEDVISVAVALLAAWKQRLVMNGVCSICGTTQSRERCPFVVNDVQYMEQYDYSQLEDLYVPPEPNSS
ncbi:hypothetical protein ACLOJK_014740 [Asimina triloba]